jgi:hypothetical protein
VEVAERVWLVVRILSALNVIAKMEAMAKMEVLVKLAKMEVMVDLFAKVGMELKMWRMRTKSMKPGRKIG